MNNKKEVAAFVRNNIADYEGRLQRALDKIGAWRCPLRMADRELYDEIVEKIEEWCDDNEVCYDEVDWDDAIDGEEGIIWEE